MVLFGLIGIGICYSTTLAAFLRLNPLLAGVGIVWVVGYAAVGWLKRSMPGAAQASPGGHWGYWGWINLVQFTAVLSVQCLIIPRDWGPMPWWPALLPGEAWDISLVLLALVYFALLVVDVALQFRNLESVP